MKTILKAISDFDKSGVEAEISTPNVDVNELISLCVQENLEIYKDNGYYWTELEVSDKLTVTFWSKKNQEPKK